jgi:division protein CdvB (Snf7/Vps24/ESCRT-III family)
MENSILERLTKAMETASEKPIQEAATILFESVKNIMTEDIVLETSNIENTTSNKEKKQGFFKKLFG